MIPLDKEIVIKALRTPYAPLRELALSYASLSRDEMCCLIGCIVDGKTNEEFAEEIERSPKFVSRHRGEMSGRPPSDEKGRLLLRHCG